MRVTKNIKEYIGRHVREKVYAKYEAERLEAERQSKIVSKFWEELEESFEAQAQVEIDNFVKTHSDFLEKNDFEQSFIGYFRCNAINIKDKQYINSVHHWRERANREVQEIMDNIIITLELGGSKADLDRMLSEI